MRLAAALALCGALLVGCGEEPEEDPVQEVLDQLEADRIEEEMQPGFRIFATDNCRSESGGYFGYEGKIRNESDVTQSFLISVEAVNGPVGTEGIRLGDASTVVPDLSPGQTAVWEVIGTMGDGIGDTFHCAVSNVE